MFWKRRGIKIFDLISRDLLSVPEVSSTIMNRKDLKNHPFEMFEELQLGTLSDWFAAIFTLLGILVALFQKDIKQFLFRPELVIKIPKRPPYVQIIPTAESGISEAQIYVRVENLSKISARNVEVFLYDLDGENKTNLEAYHHVNLHKIHSDDTIHQRLHTFLPANFLVFTIKHDLSKPFGKQNKLSFVTSPPTTSYQDLKPGKYHFEIWAICSNSKKLFRQGFIVDFDGGWSDHPFELIAKHCKISRL